MPKYLCEAGYTAEGLQGLITESAAARKAAVQKAIKGVGGKLAAFYYTFGDNDVILIVDLPDNTAMAALALAVGSSGVVQLRTTVLLTVEEVDKAIKMKSTYRAPGVG